jgi:hypothetical protein
MTEPRRGDPRAVAAHYRERRLAGTWPGEREKEYLIMLMDTREQMVELARLIAEIDAELDDPP